MIPGYNHNVKYQERVFHVQTEDSGLQNPHVTTHLFIGGTIIATVRSSYADAVSDGNATDLKTFLTELMQKQHKRVLKGLIHGEYDAPITQLQGHAAKLAGPTPMNTPAGQQRSSFGRQTHSVPSAPMVPVADDAARPAFAAAAPSRHYVAPPPVSRARAAEPPPGSLLNEQSYPEAELVEADDQSVDSLFGSLIREKTLDEVILSFIGQDKRKK